MGAFRRDMHTGSDKTSDITMSDIKYANTLAHVHQIRLDLKQTQDRYNKMASDLQVKLEEKTAKCKEIRQTFMELKREVSRKAAFSKTDKPINEKKIQEWEELEYAKSQELQLLRLEILKLRTTLAKHQRTIKKKEELADGLHLIDFEQLKIENQSLNEKIEERNEELHKLKKKNTTTVQILTHTKEKLQFEIAETDELQQKSKKLQEEFNQAKNDLKKEKNRTEKFRQDKVDLSQQTGIVNSKLLKKDFRSRKLKLKELQNEKIALEERYNTMTYVIKKYNHIINANMDEMEEP